MYAYLQSTRAGENLKTHQSSSSEWSIQVHFLIHQIGDVIAAGLVHSASTHSMIVSGPCASSTHTDSKHALIGMRKASSPLRVHHVGKQFHRHVYREGSFVATGDTWVGTTPLSLSIVTFPSRGGDSPGAGEMASSPTSPLGSRITLEGVPGSRRWPRI